MARAVEVSPEGAARGADRHPVDGVAAGGETGAVYLDVTHEAVVGRGGEVAVIEAAALVDVLHQPTQVRGEHYLIGIVGRVRRAGLQEHGFRAAAQGYRGGIYNGGGLGQMPVAVNRHIVHLPRHVSDAVRHAASLDLAGVGSIGASQRQGEVEAGGGQVAGAQGQIGHELLAERQLRHVGEGEGDAVGRLRAEGVLEEHRQRLGVRGGDRRKVEADGGVGRGHGDDEAEEGTRADELKVGIGERGDAARGGRRCPHVVEVAQVAHVAIAALHLAGVGEAVVQRGGVGACRLGGVIGVKVVGRVVGVGDVGAGEDGLGGVGAQAAAAVGGGEDGGAGGVEGEDAGGGGFFGQDENGVARRPDALQRVAGQVGRVDSAAVGVGGLGEDGARASAADRCRCAYRVGQRGAQGDRPADGCGIGFRVSAVGDDCVVSAGRGEGHSAHEGEKGKAMGMFHVHTNFCYYVIDVCRFVYIIRCTLSGGDFADCNCHAEQIF